MKIWKINKTNQIIASFLATWRSTAIKIELGGYRKVHRKHIPAPIAGRGGARIKSKISGDRQEHETHVAPKRTISENRKNKLYRHGCLLSSFFSTVRGSATKNSALA